jgi:hypothetical protein
MSVTFSPATPESVSIAHRLTCVCGAWVSTIVYPDYTSALKARYAGEAKSACVDEYCLMDSNVLFPVPAVEFPEINLANGNARKMLEVLGVDVDDDLCGEVSADDFLGRILVALALSPVDEGMPAYKISGGVGSGEGAEFWQGARPAGYTQEVLGRLREVAEFAKSKGWGVCWG